MKRFLAFLLLAPATLTAQTRTIASGYVASDPGIAGDPLMVGATVARETGPLAARLSVGFDVTAPPTVEESLQALPTGIWGTDADAMLFLGNPAGRATLIPYGLAGLGSRGLQTHGGLGASVNYSYGGGVRMPLGAGFAMEAEARYREPFAQSSAALDSVVASGMEYRFGVSLSFGGSGTSRPRGAPRLPPRPTNIPLAAMRGSSDASVRVAAATLTTAERYIGVPYRWGGNTPDSGFDCSGFIRYVFRLNGVTVPRVSRDQAKFGRPVPLDVAAFQPGDILAFSTGGREVDHTAIYAGNGRIIHSSSSGGGVGYDDLYSDRGQWFLRHMVAARRVIEHGLHLGG